MFFQKATLFAFDTDCQSSFEELKTSLVSSPIFIYPNFQEPFVLTTDASAFDIGAVLYQDPIDKNLPISHASRTVCIAETNKYVIHVVFNITAFWIGFLFIYLLH